MYERILRLGKKPPKVQPHRRLRLAKYLPVSPPPPPEAVDWTKGVTQFGMMRNDALGDCTIAACGHAIQIATINGKGALETVPDDILVSYYERWCGYNPSDPNSDQGGVEVDVLNAWFAQSLAMHELDCYADPDPGNQLHIRQAIALFGGVYIGLGLPLSAQTQLNAGQIWNVVPDDGFGSSQAYSWGGHAVFCPRYDPPGVTCITWGGLQTMTWAFWLKYCDESHALLMKDWAATGRVNPANLDMQSLQMDLELMTA